MGNHLREFFDNDPGVTLSQTYRGKAPFNIKKSYSVGNLDWSTNWADALAGQDVVIHAAAMNSTLKRDDGCFLSEMRKANVGGTLSLAKQSLEAGVKRFVFISSVKVNGDQTFDGAAFQESDSPAPKCAYGASKLEAEMGLFEMAKGTNMEVVVIRAPLVYGPGVKGSFRSLANINNLKIPLPLGSVKNKRSFIAVENLVSFIAICVCDPRAANEVFLVSDDDDVSTTEMLTKIAKVTGRSTILLPMPVVCLDFLLRLIGKGSIAKRLLGSLQVEPKKSVRLLGWRPSVTFEQGLKKCFDTVGIKDR